MTFINRCWWSFGSSGGILEFVLSRDNDVVNWAFMASMYRPIVDIFERENVSKMFLHIMFRIGRNNESNCFVPFMSISAYEI